MTKIYKKLPQKLRKPLILRASEYLSMREKEKNVSLVLLPHTVTLVSQSECSRIVDITDFMSFYIKILPSIRIRKYVPEVCFWYIFL